MFKKILSVFLKDITVFGGLFFYLIFSSFFLAFDFNLFFKLIFALVLCFFIAITIRLLYFKKRPSPMKYSNLLEKLDASSFPSLHAMRICTLSVIISRYYGLFYLYAFFFVLSLIVIISRIYLKKHDIIDVSVGSLIGIGIGLLVSI